MDERAMLGRAADPRRWRSVSAARSLSPSSREPPPSAHASAETGAIGPVGRSVGGGWRMRRALAATVEGLAEPSGAPEAGLDPLGMAARGVGARRPIMAGGGELDVGRAAADRGEIVGGIVVIAHPPGSEAGDPVGMDCIFGRAGAGEIAEPASLGVEAVQIIDQAMSLPERGRRLRRQFLGAEASRASASAGLSSRSAAGSADRAYRHLVDADVARPLGAAATEADGRC